VAAAVTNFCSSWEDYSQRPRKKLHITPLHRFSLALCPLKSRMMMLSMLKLLLIKHHFWLAIVSTQHEALNLQYK
ncbi:hypothetical protein S245_043219, partial [Arachis hypogaea]